MNFVRPLDSWANPEFNSCSPRWVSPFAKLPGRTPEIDGFIPSGRSMTWHLGRIVREGPLYAHGVGCCPGIPRGWRHGGLVLCSWIRAFSKTHHGLPADHVWWLPGGLRFVAEDLVGRDACGKLGCFLSAKALNCVLVDEDRTRYRKDSISTLMYLAAAWTVGCA